MNARLTTTGAVLLSSLLLMGSATADPDHVTPAAGTNDFNVKAKDVVTTSSHEPQADLVTSVQHAPPPPPCTETPTYADCTPIDICFADSRSPSGGFHITYTGLEHGPSPSALWMEQCNPAAGAANEPRLPDLVLRAFQRLPLPEAVLDIQPPKGKTLIGLETIFSTKAGSFSRTLTLLGRTVELRIEPTSFEWRHGDETTQDTDWPGKPWERGTSIDGYITHIYENTGRFTPSLRVTWSADYRVGNGPWQTVSGTVDRTSPPAKLQVLEAEPKLVAP